MKKMKLSWVWISGIMIFAIGVTLKNTVQKDLNLHMLSGFLAGLLGSLSVVLVSMKKNPEKMKQYEIEEKDERNNLIRGKAAVTTWSVMLMVQVAIALYFTLEYKLTLPAVLFFSTSALHMIVFFVSIAIYNKKL